MDSGPLQGDVAHREALDAIETLWGAEEGSAAGDRLERLVALVTAYEARRWPIKPLDSDALSLLRHGRAEKG